MTVGRERIGTVDIGDPTVLNLTFSGQLWSSKLADTVVSIEIVMITCDYVIILY